MGSIGMEGDIGTGVKGDSTVSGRDVAHVYACHHLILPGLDVKVRLGLRHFGSFQSNKSILTLGGFAQEQNFP